MIVCNSFKRQSLVVGLALVALFVGLDSASLAEKSVKEDKVKTEMVTEHQKNASEYKSSSSSKEGSGFQAYIDPDTGEFTHPAVDGEIELNQAVTNEAELPHDSEASTEEPAPGGGVMLVRPGGFVHFSTAQVGQGGRLSVNCTK